MFSGSNVAIVTPFKNGQIDEKKLEELIDWHIENSTSGIVPCGTTGESATLSHEEHKRVIEVTVSKVNKRVKVIAGTGSNNTKEAIELTQYAQKVGADGALVITPYYNKPTQHGLYLHFKKIAENTDIPIILYNVPGRTGVNMLPETVIKLSKIKNIVGVKEASGSMDQATQIIRLCGSDFDFLSGDDALTYPFLAIGGKGVISVVANIIPQDIARMIELYNKGEVKKACALHLKMYPLMKAMFIETNPIPIKTAMGIMGKIKDELRLPLCSMKEENKEKLKKVMKEYGLLQ